MDNPPDRIKGLPQKAKEMWIAAFNSAAKQKPGDEEYANKIAWAAVKNKYMQDEKGKWTAKDEDVEKAETKTENGQSFGRGAFLYTPSDKPSEWKLRIEESPGKVTVAQLGRAAAALGPGFRGQKVQMGADERKAAAKRLVGLYRSNKVEAKMIPRYLWRIAGMDEPAEKAANMADWFESRIHHDFTVMADDCFGNGRLTREERIALSGLIGGALDTFHEGLQGDEFEDLRMRSPWAEPHAEMPMYKREDMIEKSWDVEIVKADDEKHIIYGVVYAPNKTDTQHDQMTEAEIEKMAHGFLIRSMTIDRQHQEELPAEKATPVESYIAPVDMNIGGKAIMKGSWVLATWVPDDELWAEVKAKKINAYSFRGWAKRQPMQPAVS